LNVALLKLAAELAEKGEPFALAVVVRREASSSANPGDMALVTPDGVVHGWLGGSCTQPTVAREAREALADGAPRLLSLTPDPESARRPGVKTELMTCHSGGTVDIFVGPVLPPPRLQVFGLAPVARALARLGKAAGYAVDAVDPGADRAAFPEADRILVEAPAASGAGGGRRPGSRLLAVVATMGQRDEEALLSALSGCPDYLAVVASRKRFATLRDAALARGADPGALERVKNPAGLDIGARTPEEIAVSILADLVAARARVAPARPAKGAAAAAAETAIDPVCGMTVAVAGARHKAELSGRTFYFCRAGCRERFLADPARFGALRVGALP